VSDNERIIRYGKYPEFSWAGVIVGFILGSLICVSMGYAALMLGFGSEGSEVAAILGYGILRGLMRRSSIIENNINQTLASSVNGASAGMMFTIPALFILKHTNFDPYLLTLGTVAGGLLGIAFIIPLRKHMIDFERLPFPQGVATAVILKAPGAGVRKALLLVLGMVLSAGAHYATTSTGFEDLRLGDMLGLPPYTNVVFYLSLLTIGMAYISGKYGITFCVGGFICYFVLAPILAKSGVLPDAAALKEMEMPITSYLRLQLFRPAGIGMLIGAAFGSIILAAPLVKNAMQSMHKAAKLKKIIAKDELPIKLLYYGIGLAFLLLLVVAVKVSPEITWLRGVAIALLGTFWIWMAGVIVSECLGRTSWSPLSGMTLVAVTILVFVCSGLSNATTVIAAVTVGAAMCVAMSMAGDMMMDLKSGFLVGASPKRQQIAQFLGVWWGPILIMGVIFVLDKAYGLGGDRFPAPQAQALASTIDGILGGNVPVDKYVSGAGLGAMLSLSGLGGIAVAVALGFYLPFNIVLTYFIGIVLRVVTDWKYGHHFAQDVGIPLASGLLVGEALIAMIFALIKVFGGAL